MPITSFNRRFAGLAILILTMLALPATSTSAQGQTGDSSIEVHNRICPEGYQGQDFFNDCHDTAPDPGLTFTFSNGETHEGTTNENGNVGFASLPAGTYTITGGVPGEFANIVVYCAVGTEAESNQQQVNVTDVTGGIQLDLPADTNIICDWYNIPEDLKGDVTPTIVPTEIAPTVTVPAEPGRMVDINEGVCISDQTGSTAVELTDLRAPEQEGTDDANDVIAETSSTTVSMSLDELTNGNYVIVAHAENENVDPVACTELAGPVNANGELVLGLQEMDDSGYSGIVYLVPASDNSQTNISVFLAEGVSSESGPATPTP